jgi:hypothetical protein
MALDIGDQDFFLSRTYRRVPNEKYKDDIWASTLNKEVLLKPTEKKLPDVGVVSFLTGELFSEPKFRYVIDNSRKINAVQKVSNLGKDNQNHHGNNK